VEDAVALGVAAERGFMGSLREGSASIHEVDEAHEALSGAELDHAQTELLVKVPRQLAGLNAKLVSHSAGGQPRAPEHRVQDAARRGVPLVEPTHRAAEQVSHDALVILTARRCVEKEELLANCRYLCGGQAKRRRSSRESPQQASLGKLWGHGNDDQLEILAGAEHLVVLSRAKEQDVAALEVDRGLPDTHGGVPVKYEVELRFRMEVSGTSIRRTMQPSLGAPTRKHRKRLEYLHA